MSYDIGRFIAGVTLTAKMTGRDISNLSYIPFAYDSEIVRNTIESVVLAISQPYKKLA